MAKSHCYVAIVIGHNTGLACLFICLSVCLFIYMGC